MIILDKELPPAYEATPSSRSSSNPPETAPEKTRALSSKPTRSLQPKKSFLRLKSSGSTLSAIKDSVFELVRDLVRVDYISPPSPRSVLLGCQEACRAYGQLNLSLSECKPHSPSSMY